MRNIFILMLSLILCVNSVQARHVSKKGMKRALTYMPYVGQTSYNTGIPEWILIGVIYNESDARASLISDGGRGIGAASIHCGSRGYNWLRFLKKRGLGFSKCSDLLDKEMTVVALGEILTHIRKFEHRRRKRVTWKHVLTTYNKGPRWNKLYHGYYRRVRRFGKKIESKNTNTIPNGN